MIKASKTALIDPGTTKISSPETQRDLMSLSQNPWIGWLQEKSDESVSPELAKDSPLKGGRAQSCYSVRANKTVANVQPFANF